LSIPLSMQTTPFLELELTVMCCQPATSTFIFSPFFNCFPLNTLYPVGFLIKKKILTIKRRVVNDQQVFHHGIQNI
jgi:hypothetical protein